MIIMVITRLRLHWITSCLICIGLAGQSATEASTIVVGDSAEGAKLEAAILRAYSQGARDITIAPGTYRILTSKNSAVELDHWTNAVLRAPNVTLIFEALDKRPILLEDCEGVTLQGGIFRFAEPSFTQGRITAIGSDDTGKYIDWQVDAGYPVFDVSKSFFDVADQHTRLLKMGTGDLHAGDVQSLGNGRFRLRHLHGLPGPAAVGDWLFTRRPGGGSSVIHLNGCAHCVLRGITLQNAGFAAFFETDGGGANQYLDCRVAPGPTPPGSTEPQLVGCGADGFHSAGTRVGPTLEHCTWDGLLHDDCIAIHGLLQKVVRVEGRKLVMEKGDRGGFAVGEPVRISARNGYFGEFKCVAMRVLVDEGGLLELTLDQQSGAPTGAEASNPRCNGAGFKILNCTLGNTRSRGILVKGDNGLIEGCTISGCGMSAISIGPEYYWREGDYSQNVTVRGNFLRNNVLNGGAEGVVYVHGEGAIGNRNITIDGNMFDRNYGQNAVYIEDTDGVLILSNHFMETKVSLPEGRGRNILEFKSTRDPVLIRNTVENSANNDTLVKIDRDVEGIRGNSASGIARKSGVPE